MIDEPIELPTPASVEAIELPAPEAEEVKAALRELRATAMRAATSGEGAPDLSEAPDERAWFVVHCYSGYENKVKHNLEQRIESMGMANQIFQVVVPTEEEIEVKEGKRRTVERRVFPGYILVQMLMNDDSWYVVRNTPGVTGFVGMGNKPTPLRHGRSAGHHQAHGSRSAQGQGHVQARPEGAHRRRAVQRFHGHGRRDQHGQGQGARDGVVLWPRDAGRVGFLASRENVSANVVARCVLLKDQICGRVAREAREAR